MTTVKLNFMTVKIATRTTLPKIHIIQTQTNFEKSFQRDIQGMSKNFGKSYQKTNKTKDTNKFSLLRLKIVTILYNKRLTTFLQLPETISKGLL